MRNNILLSQVYSFTIENLVLGGYIEYLFQQGSAVLLQPDIDASFNLTPKQPLPDDSSSSSPWR